ncbi:MAG: sugar ABC transporter permease [Treponema sp.]|jgi:multiple sugar transport system permease protein|nr:sugar ABC transporter permease [Treponema sp.]
MISRKISPLQKNITMNFFVYISPWAAGFLAFVLFPVAYSFVLSFSDSTMGRMGRFVGFRNYMDVFTEDLFAVSVKNTLYYSVLGVPLQLVTAFFLASLLNMKLRGIGIFRTVFYLPSVIAGISTVLLWSWLLNSDYGLINYFLYLMHIKGPNWLTDPKWAMPSIILMSLHTVGAQMLIFLAALQDIPKELYESADIDGAGMIGKLFNIKIPQVSPTILFNLVLGIIGAFQVFMQPYIFDSLNANSGRNLGMYVYVQYLFDYAFRYFEAGYGSAIAWILFVAILVITVVIMKTSRRWVYYSGESGDEK